jgi:hypothetical protein
MIKPSDWLVFNKRERSSWPAVGKLYYHDYDIYSFYITDTGAPMWQENTNIDFANFFDAKTGDRYVPLEIVEWDYDDEDKA